MSQRYDLIGFSPRGTGASTNLICPSDESFKYEATVAADESQENIDNVLSNSRLIAENCRKNPQTPYMNSESTAKDMDLMRHLLGDSKLNYIGFSYGTWLGTWYAGLYPERVGRMMLVGNADITASLNDVLLPQGMGMQRVMDHVLAPYAARHADRFSLGGTVEEVRQAYLSLRTMMPRHLLSATSELLLNHTISKSSKADDALFYLRAAQKMREFISANPNAGEAAVKAWIDEAQFVPDQELNKQIRSKAVELTSLYFSKKRQETKEAALKGQDALQWAVMCNDSRSSFGVDDWVRENKKSAALYPLFGGYWVRNACLYWDAPAVKRPPIDSVIERREHPDAAVGTGPLDPRGGCHEDIRRSAERQHDSGAERVFTWIVSPVRFSLHRQTGGRIFPLWKTTGPSDDMRGKAPGGGCIQLNLIPRASSI